MKVIHDLKNPILAIKNTLTDLDSINIDNKTKTLIISETTDLMEMLESLKMEFKMMNNMKNDEKAKEVSTQDFIESLANSSIKLANNGKNTIKLQINSGFPKSINVQTVTLKRVMNNFITNSLKHTI